MLPGVTGILLQCNTTRVAKIRFIISILSALVFWVESPYFPVDPCVVAQMKTFSNSVTGSASMSALARKIAVIIDEKASSVIPLTILLLNPNFRSEGKSHLLFYGVMHAFKRH